MVLGVLAFDLNRVAKYKQNLNRQSKPESEDRANT